MTLAVGCSSTGGGERPRRLGLADLTNTYLGFEYSQWLVGPVSRLATVAEIEQYLALHDDAAASAFIESFWARRNPFPDEPGNQTRERFEQRAALADQRYSEAGYAGRRTARGTIFVLFGEAKVEYEIERTAAARPIEVWTYGENAPPGLAGLRPAAQYRFIKSGDLTVFLRDAPRVVTSPANEPF